LVVEEQSETWHLRSGTWRRDLISESWRLAATPDGTVVHGQLPSEDIGRMLGGNKDCATGRWFPPDFNYSPLTGASLQITIPSLDSPWVPPFGAQAVTGSGRPLARGLRQTPSPLTLIRSNERSDPASGGDRTLPPLPGGQHRFLVHKFDVASPTLMAIDVEHGNLLVHLPESGIWIPLEPGVGAFLAPSLKNWRGWRMEVVSGTRSASLYLPTARGLALLTPTVIGLSYSVEYVGQGPALGGPVAWAGGVWLPVLGSSGAVNLVGKRREAAQPAVVNAGVPPAKNGFEAPVVDPLRVIWPSEEGQLILRLGPDSKEQADWIAWPDGLEPMFSLGCPYPSIYGSFWQLCRVASSGAFQYVELGSSGPDKVAVDAPRMGTGHISYRNAQRIVGDPWRPLETGAQEQTSEIVIPLIESELNRAVLGLRVEAPRGVLALLQSDEKHRAVLQLQAENRDDALLGTLTVSRPWLTSVYVYDAHLWVYHPDLPQALGWKLFA